MSSVADILERRTRLVAEAEAQRRALAEGFAGCRSVLVVADRGLAWAAWLRARPYLVVALVTAIAVLRPRFALAWSARLLTLWRVGRLVYDAIKPLASGRALRERKQPAGPEGAGHQGGTILQGAPGPSRQAP